MGKFQDKVVLITGASRGLGAALARAFAQEQAHLILLSRQISGLEQLDESLDRFNVETTLVPVDLANPDRLARLPEAIAQKYGRLDVLIGNAAMLGGLRPITHFDDQLWYKVMDVNFHANWHLLRGLELLLKQATHPRALFVTSSVATKNLAYWGAYAASKAALNQMILTYAAENQHSSLKVNLIDPGVMATDMFQEAMPGADVSKLPKPDDITPAFLRYAAPDYQETGQLIKI
jgi:Dehydrogenases with different specificities (related to short-chain alcohol dehydrogenases)